MFVKCDVMKTLVKNTKGTITFDLEVFDLRVF